MLISDVRTQIGKCLAVCLLLMLPSAILAGRGSFDPKSGAEIGVDTRDSLINSGRLWNNTQFCKSLVAGNSSSFLIDMSSTVGTSNTLAALNLRYEVRTTSTVWVALYSNPDLVSSGTKVNNYNYNIIHTSDNPYVVVYSTPSTTKTSGTLISQALVDDGEYNSPWHILKSSWSYYLLIKNYGSGTDLDYKVEWTLDRGAKIQP